MNTPPGGILPVDAAICLPTASCANSTDTNTTDRTVIP
jgi:hypothetical protein